MFLCMSYAEMRNIRRKDNKLEAFKWEFHHINRRLKKNQGWHPYLGKSTYSLNFSIIELAYSILRTDMLSVEKYHPLEISILTYIGTILQRGNNGFIYTIDDLKKILSDFILTSYIGRIGQGLSFLVCYKNGLNFIAHSSIALKNKNPSQHKGGLADFTFFYRPYNGLVLVESKANTSNLRSRLSDVKSRIKNAMSDQVSNNLHLDGVVGGGVICTNLQPINSQARSSLNHHFVFHGRQNKKNGLSLINQLRASYYSIFNYFGYTTLASNLQSVIHNELETTHPKHPRETPSLENVKINRKTALDLIRNDKSTDDIYHEGHLIIKDLTPELVGVKVIFCISDKALDLLNYLITPRHTEIKINAINRLIYEMEIAHLEYEESDNREYNSNRVDIEHRIFPDGTMFAITRQR